jgi:outer membrane protein OmpA-like peptidoglycan-associated protein
MKQLMTSALLGACVFYLPADPAWAITSEELCQRVYEQYGLRTEGCEADTPPALVQKLEKPTQEMLENHVFFEAGGAVLDASAMAQITVLTRVLNTPLMQGACLRLVGHSDSSGSAQLNQKIGLERAEAVAAALQKGLDKPARILEVLSEGEERALKGFEPTSPFNRRVEIFAKSCD